MAEKPNPKKEAKKDRKIRKGGRSAYNVDRYMPKDARKAMSSKPGSSYT